MAEISGLDHCLQSMQINIMYGEAKDPVPVVQVRSTSPEWVATQLKEAGGGKAPAGVQAFIVNLAMSLIDNRSFDDGEWVNTLTVPYLSAHMPEADAKKAGQAFVEACRKEVCILFSWPPVSVITEASCC